MTLEILTPDKTVFQGDITSITVPGTLGYFEVLAGHAPIISSLNDGKVVIRAGKDSQTLHIKGGVIEVINDKVIVLTEGTV